MDCGRKGSYQTCQKRLVGQSRFVLQCRCPAFREIMDMSRYFVRTQNTNCETDFKSDLGHLGLDARTLLSCSTPVCWQQLGRRLLTTFRSYGVMHNKYQLSCCQCFAKLMCCCQQADIKYGDGRTLS